MVINQLENQSAKEIKFSISYLDRNEAIFLLGLLKPVPCTHCPDFYRGCKGGTTFQETAMMTENDYIDRPIAGTEAFICGKLRNLIALSRAEEQEINNQFEKDFNKRISLLTKKIDDPNKFVLIQDKDQFDSMMQVVERHTIEKIQKDVEKVNKHNFSIVKEMQEKIVEQTGIINEMQATIKKLKRKSSNVT